MRFKVLLNEEEKEIEIIRQGDRLRVSYDGRTFEVRLIHIDDAHFVLEVEEPGPDTFVCRKRIRAAGYKSGDMRQLWANGRLVNYKLIREGGADQQDLLATSLSTSIPAIVSEIAVEVGDRVKAGDKLLLLESMKMILPIKAPCNSIVMAINCVPGEAVQPGFQLVDLKEIE
jgi:biotin carboxyl carrier protein